MGQHRHLAEEVSAAIGIFERMVAEDAPDSTEAITKARVKLVQAVNGYIAYLGDQVSGASTDARLAPWKEAHCRIVELRRGYSEHIAHFSARTIMVEWQSYRASCRTLITAMRNHLEQVLAWPPID